MKGGTPSLAWIGCIVAPGSIGLNSIVAMSDGNIIATNFLERDGDQKVKFASMNAGAGDRRDGPRCPTAKARD